MRTDLVLGFFGIAIAVGLVAVQGHPSTRLDRPSTLKHHAKFEDGDDEKSAGPMEAFKWRQLAWKDGKGYIDPDGLRKAIAHREQVAAYSEAREHSRAAIGGLIWSNIGPTGISGRGRAILIDPKNHNRILEGSVGGGIWKSLDGGATFAPINDAMSNLAVCCLARDPNDRNIIFAGTGEGYFNGDALRGNGVYKSTDSGETFHQVPGTERIRGINRISVAPGDSNVLLLAGSNGLYRSTDGGSTFGTVFTTGFCNGAYVSFNPKDETQAIASVVDLGKSTYTAYFSNDGGKTWAPSTGSLAAVNGWLSRLELAYAPSNPSIVYSTNGADGLIYQSTDGGHSYALATKTGKTDLTGQGWYDNCIWVNPLDPRNILVGGSGIFESTDSGVTVYQAGGGYGGSGFQPHPDVHALVSDPGFNGTTDKALYVYTDGGTYKTDDVTTASFQPSNGISGWYGLDKAVTTQFYSIAGDAGSGYVIGGTQDNGTEQILGSGPGHFIFGGDGGYVAIDPTAPQYQYGEYVGLTIFRTTNGGGNSAFVFDDLPDAYTDANFIAPFILDPNNPGRMWAGGRQLWVSDNIKIAEIPFWTSAKPGDADLISAIAVAKGNSNIVWVGENGGEVEMTTNGLAAKPIWTRINPGGQFNRMINRILVDPDNSNIVYVALGGFTTNNLWKTSDGGKTWKTVTGAGLTGLPNAPIRGIARDPQDPLAIFVGTEVGVFWSKDGGTTWSTSNVAPTNVSVDELVFMNGSRTLLAGTHGRGLWKATVSNFGISFTPSTIFSQSTSVGTVTIPTPAPRGGLTVLLASNTGGLQVPATVVIPAGSVSASFTATAKKVTTVLVAKVTATTGAQSATTILAIQPAGLSGLAIAPAQFVGGLPTLVVGQVTLDSVAPAGGSTVNLITDDSSVVVPSIVTVPAGAKSVQFNILHSPVANSTAVTVTAIHGTGRSTFTVTTTPPQFVSLTFSPTSVKGGAVTTATLITNSNAPAGGLAVPLSSGSSAATFSTSVTVPEGTTKATFLVATKKVTVVTPVSVSVKIGTNVSFGSFTITP